MAITPPLPSKPEPTLAVNCVALLKLVMRNCPFHRTIAPLKKPDPFTVMVNPALPGGIAVGLIEAMDGPLLDPMVKVDAAVARLLVVAVTAAVRAAAMRFEGATALSGVEPRYVVASVRPLHAMDELG